MKNLIKFIQNYNRKNLHDIIRALQIFDDETDVGQGLLLAACMAVAGEAKFFPYMHVFSARTDTSQEKQKIFWGKSGDVEITVEKAGHRYKMKIEQKQEDKQYLFF